MRYFTGIAMGFVLAGLASAQTADELIAKNLAAHGGVEKLRALHSLRMTGKMHGGSVSIEGSIDTMAPDLFRQTFSLMGMTEITAYDGAIGWRIMPFTATWWTTRKGQHR